MNRAEHLTGKTAIITGAAGGIGEALSRKMAAYGMKLVLTGRNAGKLNAFADELRAGGAEVVTCAGDLADLAFVDETLSAARKAFGGIDVIINNISLSGNQQVIFHGYNILFFILTININRGTFGDTDDQSLCSLIRNAFTLWKILYKSFKSITYGIFCLMDVS